jgi:hypothetical protein
MMSENKNHNIVWKQNSFRKYLLKMFSLTLMISILLLFLSFYFFFVNKFLFVALLVIGGNVLIISFASIFTYRISPTFIGFSKYGIHCKYDKIPPQDSIDFFPLKFVQWKDIKAIEQEISHTGYLISPKTIHDLRDKKVQNPIRGSLLIHTTKPGINYKLSNVSKDIMLELIERSGTISNISHFQ